MANVAYSAVVLDDRSRKELLVDNDILLMRGIYVIENTINNKKYIGSTMKSFFVRFKAHVKSLKNNRHENPILQFSWNKYGRNNFIFTILESYDVIETKQLLKLEGDYILKFNTSNKKYGFNICSIGGSNFGTKWSEESRLRRCGAGNPMFGKGEMRRGELNPMFGKTLSESHKKKMSISLTGLKKPITGIKLSKPVLQLDVDLNTVCEYPSYIKAQEITQIWHISEACNGHRKTAGGYYWKWKKL